MPSLSIYQKECITLNKDSSVEGWKSAISRLNKEWSRIENEKEELINNGIYITAKEDLSEFTVMIFKEKDAGPYNFIPLFFTIKPCKEIATGLVYPLVPPIVQFHSFNNNYIHPNFKTTGDVCISILEYSYIGPGSTLWNPSIGIKTIAIILSSLLTECALKNEPMFSNELSTSSKCINYDTGVEYMCMNHILKELDREDIPLKEVLLSKRKSILDYIISKTFNRKDISIKTYAFELNTDYNSLYNRATQLAHNDHHSN